MSPEQIREALDMFDVDLYPEIAEAARAYADLLDRGSLEMTEEILVEEEWSVDELPLEVLLSEIRRRVNK